MADGDPRLHAGARELAQPGIEIVFSILQRKILTPNDCRDLDDVARRIGAFEQSFNERGEPFHWRFTRSDLELFLKKLEAHEDPPTERAAA